MSDTLEILALWGILRTQQLREWHLPPVSPTNLSSKANQETIPDSIQIDTKNKYNQLNKICW